MVRIIDHLTWWVDEERFTATWQIAAKLAMVAIRICGFEIY